jgi:hypothetical protein
MTWPDRSPVGTLVGPSATSRAGRRTRRAPITRPLLALSEAAAASGEPPAAAKDYASRNRSRPPGRQSAAHRRTSARPGSRTTRGRRRCRRHGQTSGSQAPLLLGSCTCSSHPAKPKKAARRCPRGPWLATAARNCRAWSLLMTTRGSTVRSVRARRSTTSPTSRCPGVPGCLRLADRRPVARQRGRVHARYPRRVA